MDEGAAVEVKSAEKLEIEKLLDEVEVKFLTNFKVYDPSKIVVSLEEAQKCPCTRKTETNWGEVDELLKDLDDQQASKRQDWEAMLFKEVKAAVEMKEDKREVKCIPPFLGGSYEDTGYSAPGFEKACSSLSCLTCDFEVAAFDNFVWDPSTDYYFLRNHMPNFQKVSQKLRKKKGMRAYGCQCQHVSIDKLTNLNSFPQLKWICKKHGTEK